VNATRYEIVVIATDGRRLLFNRPAGTRSVVIAGFAASGATVKAVGIGPDGNTGPAAIARLPRLAAPGRVNALSVKRNANEIVVSWHPAARAYGYRVTLMLDSRTPFALLTTRHTIGFALANSGTGVRIGVQGEGALGELGPKSSAQLAPTRKRRS
jgi:hypothetical protein